MKKILTSLLVLLLVVGCSKPADKKDDKKADAAAEVVKEVSVKGHEKDLQVKVTFKENKIANVEVVKHNETAGISDEALKTIPAKIVEKNSVKVDVVSGATETSNGIIEAVKQAIKDAGLNVADFEK